MTTAINPKYKTQCEEGQVFLLKQEANRDTKFYSQYNQDIAELHKQLWGQVLKASEFNWPLFSLKKVKLFSGETLTDLLLANAIALALEYKATEHENGRETSEAEFKDKALRYYDALVQKKVSLASPFFNNLRKEGNKNLSSCFIYEPEDSLKSIMKHVTYAAEISKAGGGSGVFLGKIRGKGASIAGNKNAASGVMPFVRLFDQVCVSVNQLGQRAGAITVALPIWHIDIEEFLDCQTENGDLRAKAYNIQPQVCIDNEFMHAVIANKEYGLYCPKSLSDAGANPESGSDWRNYVTPIKWVNARKIWGIIQERQHTVGRPYIFFTDNAQINSPFKKHYGDIRACNLCTESFSYFEAERYIHCCNLISINLAEHSSLEEVTESTTLATEMADLSLNISVLDIPEAQKHIRDFRTIGIGLMGLADWLAYNGSYYSDLDLIEATQKTVSQAAYNASVRLASKWGLSEAPVLDNTFWKKLGGPSGARPRNTMLLATAPNTSTSLVMGATASFLPPYKTEFVDESEDSVRVVTKYVPERYLINQHIPQEFITDCAARMQKWTDAGISFELLLPKGAPWSTNKRFSDNKISAWKQGVKAVYYVRTTDALSEGGCGSGACSN